MTNEIINKNKIVLATRVNKENYKICIDILRDRIKNDLKNNFQIEKIFVICDLYKAELLVNDIPCEVIFDINPTRPTAFNRIIDKLVENKKEQYHLLTFSKEVEFKDEHIGILIDEIEANRDKLIVAGYKLRDNVSSDQEIRIFANEDSQTKNTGIAYLVPWNTFALWNKNFVYGSNKSKLRYDEICEKENNQLRKLNIKINDRNETTDFEGMEDGLAIAELVFNNSDNKSDKKYKLINDELGWNIIGNDQRILNHKKKLARKNIILSTFINIKGYSIEKLRKAAE